MDSTYQQTLQFKAEHPCNQAVLYIVTLHQQHDMHELILSAVKFQLNLPDKLELMLSSSTTAADRFGSA